MVRILKIDIETKAKWTERSKVKKKWETATRRMGVKWNRMAIAAEKWEPERWRKVSESYISFCLRPASKQQKHQDSKLKWTRSSSGGGGGSHGHRSSIAFIHSVVTERERIRSMAQRQLIQVSELIGNNESATSLWAVWERIASERASGWANEHYSKRPASTCVFASCAQLCNNKWSFKWLQFHWGDANSLCNERSDSMQHQHQQFYCFYVRRSQNYRISLLQT